MRALIFLGYLIGAAALSAQSPYASTQIQHFTVRTKADCFAGAGPDEVADFWAKLRAQIDQLRATLPADKVARLQRIPIYVHRGEHHPFGCRHHPSRDWLVRNGYPAEMANSVEVCNWREFRTLVIGQPACLIHEYAHAWQFVSPGLTQLIRPAYERAVKAGLYQAVAHTGEDRPVRAYALENDKEYFAELSEAYFARNDFFPFVRSELQGYDPAGFAMIERVWAVR